MNMYKITLIQLILLATLNKIALVFLFFNSAQIFFRIYIAKKWAIIAVLKT